MSEPERCTCFKPGGPDPVSRMECPIHGPTAELAAQTAELARAKGLLVKCPDKISCECDWERVIPLPENEHWRDKAIRQNHEMCLENKPEMRRVFNPKCMKHSIETFLNPPEAEGADNADN